MPCSRQSISWLVAVLMMVLTLDALAQFPGGNRGRAGGGRPQGGAPRGEPVGSVNDFANVLEFRLESMQEDLKLSPAQQRLFDAYADRVRALGEDIVRERERSRTQSATQLTAPQQIDHLIDVTRDRMTALEDIAASAKSLYASLTAEQKLLADSRVATLMPLLAGTATALSVPDQRRAVPPAGAPRDREAAPPR